MNLQKIKNNTYHPLIIFICTAIPISWVILTLFFLAKLPTELAVLLLNYLVLLGVALFLTHRQTGKLGIKELFAGLAQWRVNWVYYAVAIFGIPFLSIGLLSITGNFSLSSTDLLTIAIRFMQSLITGALIINLVEETVWMGFFQSRLMARNGVFVGSIITAPFFAAIHIPLFFTQATIQEFALSVAVVFFLAFFFRYLLGIVYSATNNSLFIVGMMHASFNSASALTGTESQIATIVATIVLTCLFAFYKNRILVNTY